MHFKHVIRARAPALLLLLAMLCSLLAVVTAATDAANPPSDQQINDRGGTTESIKDDGVKISKTIEVTDIENVFDITLTVTTQENIAQITSDPDLAVVIVMDISNTMTEHFNKDQTAIKWESALTAANNFIEQFVDATKDSQISKLGFVTFNTDAYEVLPLEKCDSSNKEKKKNTVKNNIQTMLNNEEYSSTKVSHNHRFTNIEAGLKRASDMLDKAQNSNKYIIFLSDGFPTTYIIDENTQYNGYDTYNDGSNLDFGEKTKNKFYDSVLNKYCTYGTSYSDEAAIRARKMATTIKNKGTTIFSIGVDIGGQTIKYYVDLYAEKNFSVVDRTSENYEIGSADSADAYKNWLKNSIGSGYYYDSTNSTQLTQAFDNIFAKIQQKVEESSRADWVTSDPMPSPVPETIEFIGFYNQSGTLISTTATPNKLSGEAGERKENTAKIEIETDETGKRTQTIHWDLKSSGYRSETETSGDKSTTTYYYELKYRVRLENEKDNFTENTIYKTNDTTTLTYRVYEKVDNTETKSEQRELEFNIPSVYGYLGELTFNKVALVVEPDVSTDGSSGSGETSAGSEAASTPQYVNLAGAEFQLKHDDKSCSKCRGDGTIVADFPIYTATSAEDGKVTFSNIPSGHVYTLSETKAPPGYIKSGTTYKVTIAYDEVTVEGTGWKQFVNAPAPELPSTGGTGTLPFFVIGSLLVTTSLCGMVLRRKKTAYIFK